MRRRSMSYKPSIGFPQEALQSVCISFDKLDKIGMDGVAEELIEKGMPAGAVDKLTEIVSAGDMSPTKVKEYCSDPKYAEDVDFRHNTMLRIKWLSFFYFRSANIVLFLLVTLL